MTHNTQLILCFSAGSITVASVAIGFYLQGIHFTLKSLAYDIRELGVDIRTRNRLEQVKYEYQLQRDMTK